MVSAMTYAPPRPEPQSRSSSCCLCSLSRPLYPAGAPDREEPSYEVILMRERDRRVARTTHTVLHCGTAWGPTEGRSMPFSDQY
jgi:hypothetical protein